MHFQNTRILKEARALFWPWFAVTLAAALSLVPSGFSFPQTVAQGIASLGFWLGIPLLATLSFGNEFQHQTFALMLSQPIDRMTIWREKMIVVLAAVLSSASVYAIGYRNLLTQGAETAAFLFTWLVVTVSAAVVCSLVARSTVGGIILNCLHAVLLAIAGVAIDRFLGPKPAPETVRMVFGLGAAVAAVYGILMVWIGRLTLGRFQATGTANSDLLLSSPDALRAAFSGFLRCRPDSPFSNLVLKELRLLWPLSLLAMLFSVLLACLAPLQWTQGNNVVRANLQYIIGVIFFLYAAISMLLAGCLSMGDERTLGTQLWHMTLPISAGRQWFVKLSVAILATFAGLLFVFNVGQLFLGFQFADQIDDMVGGHSVFRLFALSLLSFPAFWCACAVKGTVRAALWAIPSAAAVSLACRIGMEFALFGLLFSAPMVFLASKIHSLRPMSQATYEIFANFGFAILIPLLFPALVGLIQSRRLFRREVPENSKALLRALVWPVSIAFVLGFAFQIPRVFADASWMQGREVLSSVFTKVQQLPMDLGQTDKAHPRQLTPAEVAMVVSSDARLWIDEPRISVYSEQAFVVRPTQNQIPKRTVLVAHLSNGLDCTVTTSVHILTGAPLNWKFVLCIDPHEDRNRFAKLRRWLRFDFS